MAVIIENRSGNMDEMIHILAVDKEKGELVGELSIGFKDLVAGMYQVGIFCMNDGYKENGYGRKMMEAAIACLKERNAKSLYVKPDPMHGNLSMEKLRAIYTKLGFRPVKGHPGLMVYDLTVCHEKRAQDPDLP